MKEINGLKIKYTGKWLVDALEKDEAMISRWRTNEARLSCDVLFAVAKVVNVDIRNLLISTKK